MLSAEVVVVDSSIIIAEEEEEEEEEEGRDLRGRDWARMAEELGGGGGERDKREIVAGHIVRVVLSS